MSNRRRPQSAKVRTPAPPGCHRAPSQHIRLNLLRWLAGQSAVRITGSAARPLQSKEFDRLKNPRALGRPQSAGPSLSRSAPDLGWTITTGQSGQIHIPNSATGFIKSISDTSSYELDEDQKITMMFKPDMQVRPPSTMPACASVTLTSPRCSSRGPRSRRPSRRPRRHRRTCWPAGCRSGPAGSGCRTRSRSTRRSAQRLAGSADSSIRTRCSRALGSPRATTRSALPAAAGGLARAE